MNDELTQGTILRGRYKIEWKVGGGNMGIVYKALDMQLNDRPVAIKEMRSPDPAQSGLDLNKAVHLFKREAAILSGLNHPNLPHVYDTFEEQGKYYLVMDYIEGETLLQKLDSYQRYPLDVRDVVNYAIELCDILDYLHKQHPQVIFRDLKPSNVIINRAGHVFLIDFGIARHFNPAQAADTIAIGTSGYSDPEISLMKQANPRSDLYGLGATLHHCLTAKVPNYGYNQYQFPSVINFNRNVPQELNNLIMKLVEPRSARRPASAGSVRKELLRIQSAFQVLASAGTIAQIDHNAPTVQDPFNNLTQLVVPPIVHDKSLAELLDESLHRLAVTVAPLFGTIWKTLLVLFSLVFVAGKFVFGLMLSPITHRRVSDLWHQAQQSAHTVFQQIQHGYSIAIPQMRRAIHYVQHLRTNWSWAWLSYSPIWRPRFLALLGSLLALIIAINMYLLHAFHGSYPLVDFSLSFLLLFILYVILHITGELAPRRILAMGGLFVLAFLLTQVLLPVVGPPGQLPTAQVLTASSLLTWVLLASAALMLASGCIISISQMYQQSAPWRGWVDRLALFALISSWTLMQYFSGSMEQLPFAGASSHPLAAVILSGQNSSIPAITVNQTLCLPLALIGVVLLLRTKERITAGDRRWLLVAIVPFLLLQWNNGVNELLHIFPSISQATAVSMNVLLFLALIGAIFVMQRSAYKQFDLGDRLALLLLIVASVALQIELNSGNVHTPLSTPLPSLSFSLVLPVVFITVGLWLLFSPGQQVKGPGRVLLFAFAIACAIMEFACGQAEGQSMSSVSGPASSAQLQSLALADLYRIIAVLLVLSVLITATLTIVQKLKANPQQTMFAYAVARMNRLITFGVVLVSLLLLLAFTWQNILLPEITHPDVLFNQITTFNPPPPVLPIIYLLLAITLLILGIIAFVRLFNERPAEGKDRLFFLVAGLTCMLLLLENNNVKSLPLLSESTQQLFGNASQIIVLNFIAVLSIIGAALVSLFWLKRPFTNADRAVLCILFTASAVFALVQPAHTQLFLSLLILILGTLIAMQIERVRVGTRRI